MSITNTLCLSILFLRYSLYFQKILRIVTLTKRILIHIKVKCSERTNHPTHTKEHSFIQFIHTLEKTINYGVGEL